jgi:putative membrane protein
MKTSLPYSHRIKILGLAALALSSAGLFAQNMPETSSTTGTDRSMSSSEKTSRFDRRFIEKAAKAGHEEVVISQIAVDRTANSEVKSFARQMVDDHENANKELRDLALKKGVALPVEKRDASDIKKWSDKKSSDFDKDYIKDQVDMHEDAIDLYEKAAKKADDPEVSAFANKILPTLRAHYEHAKQLEKSLK